MFGKKIVVSIIVIIAIVLLMSNVCSAATAIDEESNDIFGRCIFPLIIEIANLIISVILLLKNKIKKSDCILVSLLNIVMIFATIRFWSKNYSIWTTILFLNTIIQIVIIIYLIYKMLKKEGEKSVKNRK